jgi:CheY-like chemotaxis protein
MSEPHATVAIAALQEPRVRNPPLLVAAVTTVTQRPPLAGRIDTVERDATRAQLRSTNIDAAYYTRLQHRVCAAVSVSSLGTDRAQTSLVVMRPVRALIADESPAMRQWYAAALQRVADQIEGFENGWELLLRLADDRPYDLVVASRSLPGLGGVQILAMLRAAGAHVPFVLVAPFCDGSVRARVARLPSAALIEDSLDAVGLADTAAALVTSSPVSEAEAEKVRRAVALRARNTRTRRRQALG